VQGEQDWHCPSLGQVDEPVGEEHQVLKVHQLRFVSSRKP